MFFFQFCIDFESEINDNMIIVELRIYRYAGKKNKIVSMTLLGQTLFPFCKGGHNFVNR